MPDKNNDTRSDTNREDLIRLTRTEFEIEQLKHELNILKEQQKDISDKGNRLDKEGALREQLIANTDAAIQNTINGLLENLEKTRKLVDEIKSVAVDHAQCETHREMIYELKNRSEKIEQEFEKRLKALETEFHDRKLYLKTLLKVGGAAVGMITTVSVLLSNIERCREAIEHLIDFLSRTLFQNNPDK